MNSLSFDNLDTAFLAFKECLRNGLSDNYVEALKTVKAIQNPYRSFFLGVIYMQQWEDGCAREEFKHFLRQNPKSRGALCNLAIASEGYEDSSQIFSLLESALETSSDSRINAMTLAECLVNAEKMNLSASSQERKRAWLLKESAKTLLIDTISKLLKKEDLSEEWLLNYGGAPKTVERWIEGPIDAHKYTFLRFGEAIFGVSLEKLSFRELYNLLERWDYLMMFHRDKCLEFEAPSRFNAKIPQRDCCIEP